MIGIQDTEKHLRRRKNWNRGMSPVAIKEYQPFIAKRARQLVDRLEDNLGVVNIGDWFNFFSCVFLLYSLRYIRSKSKIATTL